MNKTAKYLLIGIGTFIGCLLAIVLLRVLIKGIPFADGIKSLTNWLFAAIGGIGSAYSLWKKDQQKKYQIVTGSGT